ncbi:MAG: hypothetical protein ACRDNF_18925 [Streptosporangiaceae bacterium]
MRGSGAEPFSRKIRHLPHGGFGGRASQHRGGLEHGAGIRAQPGGALQHGVADGGWHPDRAELAAYPLAGQAEASHLAAAISELPVSSRPGAGHHR